MFGFKGKFVLVSMLSITLRKTGFARPTTAEQSMAIPSRLVEYMTRYGYLPQTNGASALRDSASIQPALIRLQRFHRLEPTGVLDEATRKLLTAERCGVPDFQTDMDLDKKKRRNRQLELLNRFKRYVLHGSSWPVKSLTFEIVNSASTMRMYDAREILLQALFAWQQVSGLKFKENRSGNASIQMSFQRRIHSNHCNFPNDQEIAHAFYPNQNYAYKGDIHFNNELKWSKNLDRAPRNEFRLAWAAIHEIGHALGLDHSREEGSIMQPIYDEASSPDLSTDDILAIQRLYGKPSVAPKTTTTTAPIRSTRRHTFTKITKRTTTRRSTMKPRIRPFRRPFPFQRTTPRSRLGRNRVIGPLVAQYDEEQDLESLFRSETFEADNELRSNSALGQDNQDQREAQQDQEQDLDQLSSSETVEADDESRINQHQGQDQGNRFIRIHDEDIVYADFRINERASGTVFVLDYTDGTQNTITLFKSNANDDWFLRILGNDYFVSNFKPGDTITIRRDGESDILITFS